MKLSKLLGVAIMFALVSGTVFGGGQAATPAPAGGKKDPKDIKLAAISMNNANPWCLTAVLGFEARCKELGVQCLKIDSQYKIDKQVNDIETLINDKYDGFTFMPIDQNATNAVVEAAKKAGMATASIAQPQDNANLIYTLDEYEYGLAIGGQAGEWIRDNLGGRAKVAIISQDNVEAVIARGDGVRDGILKAAPNANIVSRQAGDFPEKGQQIIESVLAAHPDLNVVVGTNDSGAIGGYQAMVTNRKTGPDRAVFSGDATAETLNLMRQPNSIYRGTVDLMPWQGGYESAQILYDWIVNGTTPSQPKIVMFNPVPVPVADLLSGKYKPVEIK
jgi:ABC-type sugar transport system substrate-binding protein